MEHIIEIFLHLKHRPTGIDDAHRLASLSGQLQTRSAIMSRIRMSKYALYVAAALVLAPGLAVAQTADPNHPAPGAGSRIPEVMRMTEQPLAAYQTDPSIPGDGYRIVAVPRTTSQPLAAYPADAGIPGDGYRIN